jgi:hypothetical protein
MNTWPHAKKKIDFCRKNNNLSSCHHTGTVSKNKHKSRQKPEMVFICIEKATARGVWQESGRVCHTHAMKKLS